MAAEDPGFVSQADYGRHRGVSRKTVTDWKQKGILVLDARGRVDVAKTDAALNDRPATYRGGVTSEAPRRDEGNKSPLTRREVTAAVTPEGNTVVDEEADGLLDADISDEGIESAGSWKLAEATRVKEIYLALKRRQEYLVSQGALVAIEEVAVQLEAEYTIVRERLLGIPGKIAASLVGLDRAAIEEKILEEISEALSELHDQGNVQAGSAGASGSPDAGEART
ncbi:hypothetical protein OSH11_17200 [Kaistia dalseonensis]|uniref:Phage terminase Nu1 subunit (DNA packaging protein) n=1 Tax=Kaistia dalseonensis TaxID=410840 RepID=A0ABU0H9S2_9HYPH|nr:hypothetical protein [Kaistia dalseonensis]MCX5496447.1 hypothetical protein [Kaistia dalseonensis]MDQ0439068.1 phage terminase Nu1 subunit (DNA packaging protein) [Kaistia dalseonensis]